MGTRSCRVQAVGELSFARTTWRCQSDTRVRRPISKPEPERRLKAGFQSDQWIKAVPVQLWIRGESMRESQNACKGRAHETASRVVVATNALRLLVLFDLPPSRGISPKTRRHEERIGIIRSSCLRVFA